MSSRVHEITEDDDDTFAPPVLPSFQPPKVVKCSCCFKMLVSGQKKCSKCKQVTYCSEECQRKDWPKHKLDCREQEKTDEEKYTEAKQDFKKNFEQPEEDSIETMLRKVAVQTQAMKYVAGTGTRTVNRSVKREVSCTGNVGC
jgi:hypothetical protein